MRVWTKDTAVSINAIFSWDVKNFISETYLRRMYGTPDVICSCINKPLSIRRMENDMYAWDREKSHIWETNPFRVEVNNWFFEKRWAYNSCLWPCTVEFPNENEINYRYRTFWWDHLEWYVNVAKKYHIDISVRCEYYSNENENDINIISYSINDRWEVLNYSAIHHAAPTRELITEWAEPFTDTVTVRRMTQEEYDQIQPHSGITFIY